jgi:hypothetical protein
MNIIIIIIKEEEEENNSIQFNLIRSIKSKIYINFRP